MRNVYKDAFPQTFPESIRCQFCGDILQENTKHNTSSNISNTLMFIPLGHAAVVVSQVKRDCSRQHATKLTGMVNNCRGTRQNIYF